MSQRRLALPLACLLAGGLFLAACSSGPDKVQAVLDSQPSLARLDRQLNWTVSAALELDPASGLEAEQEGWTEGLARCLDSEDPPHCLAEAHMERLEKLQERFGLDAQSVALHAAALEGFLYRALGNEPGWLLLLAEDHAVWETDYGQTRHEIHDLVREVQGDREVFRGRLQDAEFEVRVATQPCEDDMSGEAFPLGVELRHGGRTLRGCADPARRISDR